ncbi:MAG: DUF6577 family protein [Balneolaceae bacterium]
MSDIATDKLHIEDLKAHFSDTDVFKTKDITAFFRSFEPKLKKSTINWRVYHLVQKGILERIGRGTFKLGQKKIFEPTIGKQERSIAELIQSRFPYADYCVWNTSVINQFMVHQPFRFVHMVEVDKEAASNVFNELKEEGCTAFLKPGREIMNNYLRDAKNPVIIKPLITEAPIQEIDHIPTITLEKLLVDLFADTVIFTTYQGKELSTIYQEAFNAYTVNVKKLLRYADRRKQRPKITYFLESLDLLPIKHWRDDL